MGRRWMSEIVNGIADIEPLNPFFQYVAHRRSTKEGVLPQIFKEDVCPSSAKTDPLNPRRQWSWERDTAEKAWINRMYWDCLFIASMYKDETVPPADDESMEDVVRKALDDAMAPIPKRLQDAQAALQKIIGLKDALPNPVSDPIGTAQKVGEEAIKKGDEAIKKGEEVLHDAGTKLNDAAKGAGKTLDKLSPLH
jgi:hypothetical protein